MDAAEVRDEIQLWLDVIRAAARMHETMPRSITRAIESQQDPRSELMTLAVHVAGLSTDARQLVERVLSHAVMHLPQHDEHFTTPFVERYGAAAAAGDGPALRLVQVPH